MFHKLGPVKGIRFAKFYIPEQYAIGSGLLDLIQQVGMTVIVRIVNAAARRWVKKEIGDSCHQIVDIQITLRNGSPTIGEIVINDSCSGFVNNFMNLQRVKNHTGKQQLEAVAIMRLMLLQFLQQIFQHAVVHISGQKEPGFDGRIKI